MRGVTPILAAVVVVAGTACAAARDPEPEQSAWSPVDLIGCYQVTVHPDGTEADRASWSLPSVIRLSDGPVPEWPGLRQQFGDSVYQVRSWQQERWRDIPFAYWRPVEGDSIHLAHPGALAGVTMVLAVPGDTLEGRITTHTDVLRPGETVPRTSSAPVEARRVTCPDGAG